MNRSRMSAVAVLLVAVAVVAGCGPGGNGESDTSSSRFDEIDCADADSTTEVEVGPGFEFVPANVTIDVGTTVKWTWADGVSSEHDVVADNDSDCSSARPSWFESSRSSMPGTTYCVRFEETGTWNYQCTVPGHCGGGMKGTVTVQSN